MTYKFLFLILFGLLFLHLSYATNITGCQAIGSSYLNETLVLQNDLNESVLADYNACFYLEDDFSGASLTIDCNFHTISITANNVSLDTEISDIFANYWEEDNNDNTLHAFSLDSLTFKNCNFNFEAYIYYDSEDDANYEYGVSVLGLSGADGNVFVNEINIIDSNMYVEGQGISFEDFILDSLDINFYGSYFEPVEVESEYELDYEPNFIDLESGFLGTLIINDLTDGNFENINSFIKVTNKLERYDFDSCNINIDDQTDINLLVLQNVSLNFLKLYDMSYYFDVIGVCDPIAYDDFSVLRDSNLQIIFDNVDINFLFFENIDLNINTYENISSLENLGNAFLKLTNNSDINYILFQDSNILLNAGSLFLFSNNNDNFLDVDFEGLNIADFDFENTGNSNLFSFVGSNSNVLTAYNLNSENNELSFMQLITSDLNYVNFYNSHLITESQLIFFAVYNDDFLDLNFYDSEIIVYNNNPFNFFNFGVANSIDSFNIYYLDLNTDENMFLLDNTIIGELTFTNNFFRSSNLLDVDELSSINSGLIYNNIFLLDGPLMIYGENVVLDFNTSLQENSSLRRLLILDSSSYIGGNLWLTESWDNVCDMFDIFDDSEPYGICDSALDLNNDFVDYYPLIAYGVYNVDLVANSLNVSINYDDSLDLNIDFNFSNVGEDEAFDYNILVYLQQGELFTLLYNEVDTEYLPDNWFFGKPSSFSISEDSYSGNFALFGNTSESEGDMSNMILTQVSDLNYNDVYDLTFFAKKDVYQDANIGLILLNSMDNGKFYNFFGEDANSWVNNNLILNPNFDVYEKIVDLDNWGYQYYAFSPEKSNENNFGDYSLNFKGAGSFDSISIVNYFFEDLVFDDEYILEFWAKNMLDENLLLAFEYRDENDNSYNWNFFGDDANTWTLSEGPNENILYFVELNAIWNKYSVPQITIPDKNIILIIGSISSDVYLDDVNFYNVNNFNNVILNSSFEDWTETDYYSFDSWFFGDENLDNFGLETDFTSDGDNAVKFKGYNEGETHYAGSLRQTINLNSDTNYNLEFSAAGEFEGQNFFILILADNETKLWCFANDSWVDYSESDWETRELCKYDGSLTTYYQHYNLNFNSELYENVIIIFNNDFGDNTNYIYLDDLSLYPEGSDGAPIDDQLVMQNLTTDYVKYTVNNIYVPDTNSIYFLFYFQEGREILLDSIELIKQGSENNILSNGDFEDWNDQLVYLYQEDNRIKTIEINDLDVTGDFNLIVGLESNIANDLNEENNYILEQISTTYSDLFVYDYDYLSDFFFNNGNLDFNIFYTNLGNSSIDVNILVYLTKSRDDFNFEEHTAFVLDSLVTVLPDNNYNSFFRYIFPTDFVCMGENCGGPEAGLYGIYVLSLLNNELCTLDIDSNCENNYLFEENIFAFYDDGNYLLEIYDIDVNQNVEGNIRVDCNILNVGDINSNLDYNVFLGYGDYNYVSHEYEFEFTQDNISESISAFGSKIVSFNVDVNAEDYNFRCEVADLGYSDGQYIKEFTFNSIDSNSAIDLVAESVDLNSYNVNLGEYIDLNFVYSNLGPDNATDFNLICGVYSNDIFLTNMFNENISGSFIGTDSYTMTILGGMAGSYDFNCYLISNAEADSNMLNNFAFGDTLTVSEGIDSNYIDVSIINVDVNDDYIEIGDSINVTCDFNNLSTLDTNYDLNAEIFVVDSWSLIGNHSGTLLENTSSSWSFSATTDSLSAGDYNLRCIIDANEDINLNNNSEILTISVYDVPGENTFVDLNASLSSSSYVTKGNVIEMNLTIANDGNKATDSNYIIYFYTDNELEESCTINRNNVLAPNDGVVFGCEIDSSDISIGAHTLKGVVDYLGVDINSDNNSDEVSITLQYVDLNATNLQISDGNVIYGDTFDMNFVLTNSGDANTDTNYLIQFFIDDAEIEICTQNIANILSSSNNIVYSCNDVNTLDYSLGLHTLKALVNYLGYDNNSDNNFVIAELYIKFIDLNAQTLDFNSNTLIYGQVLDINFGYKNIGNADANADYNVIYYISNTNNSPAVANYLISDDLLSNTIDYNSYFWTANILGDVNIYVCINYSEIEYSELNNCIQETYHVYYRDISVINAEVISDVIYGGDLNISVDLNNLGDFNSDDVNVYIYVLDSQNADNNLINPVTILDFGANDGWNITSSFSNFNLTLNDLNILVEVITSEEDYNLNNHSSILFGNVANVYYADLNVVNLVFDNNTPVYGSNVTLDLNIENNGNYDANDINVLVYFIENANTDNNFVYFTIEDFTANETTTLNVSWEDINILGFIDVFVELQALNDYNLMDNNKIFSNVANVGFVDLNSYIIVPDVNAGYTIDVNCVVNNRGNLTADSYTIYYYLNGELQDSNILSNLGANESYTQSFSFSPSFKANDQNLGCIVSYDSDYNLLNNNYFVDKNVGADSDVDLLISNIGFTGSLTDYSAKTIDCNLGNVGLENAVEDYNVLFYVNNTLIDYNLVSEDLNMTHYNLVSFNWTPIANGTYVFKCVVDYNILNYNGYDQNVLNDYLTLSKTINLTSNNNSNNSSTSGGSNVSGIIKQNEDSTLTFIYNPKNTFSLIYLDSITFGYKFNYPSKDLILNVFPNVPENTLINVPKIFVIKYFELNYSGDQTNLDNIIVNFSIKKSEILDPKTIRLARYHNNQWTYYPTDFVDKGIYYQFSANIPGFSYFAIVDYNLIYESPIDSNVPKDVNYNDNLDTNSIINNSQDQNNVLLGSKKFSLGYKTTVIILGIIGILILMVLFLINRFRKRKLDYNSAFKFAKAENYVLEKKLKEKTGYDL